MTTPRRVLALAVGLVLSTLLLGGGWLWSTWRERQTRLRESSARLERVADVVRGAVDESLEALRRREDERPFYLYGYYYSPPEVLAISDPVAVSPLAHPPDDPRVIGHFQIDPGGAVRTPYTPDADGPPHPLSARVRGIVSDEAFGELRELTSAAPRTPQAATPDEGRRHTSLLTLSVGDAPPPEVGTNDSVETLRLNEYGNQQAMDINAAQAGDPEANLRVLERGRQVPNIVRRDVSWSEAREQQQRQRSIAQAPPQNIEEPQQQPPAQTGALPRRPSTAAVRRGLDARRAAVAECAPAAEVVVRLRVRGADGAPDGITVSGVDEATARCVRRALADVRLPRFGAETLVVGYLYGRAEPEAPELADATGLDNMVQREAEVEYTPMTFRRLGDHLVLHRLVTHEGAAVVQGVLIDRERLRTEWIPSRVARHASGDAVPTVVSAGDGACAVRAPASAVIDGVELCFAPGALAAATTDLDTELGWQLAALLALLCIALLAAFAIVHAARRAQALSRQKSAFVSAVSHELRTPLTTLRMHAEMLDEDLVSDARRPKVHRELVRESVRLARLVDNVLSLSKLEEGRRRLALAEGDLRAHVREVVEGQRALVEERGFELRAPDGPALECRFDPQAVEQIVVNLLDNAVKYGAGAEDVIEVRVEPPGTLIVSDRGPGIPEPERRRVFERFHRVEREEHAHAPGTGIGLSLVAELAESHGGEATVRPRDGGGLEVHVRLTE